jgi:glycerol-3-phosphate acyltransferase PlsY
MREYLDDATWTWLGTWAFVAYLTGSLPIGLMIGKLRGINLREVGSGNIGATNAVRALGRKWGLPVFFLDVAKAAIPIWLARENAPALDRDAESIVLSVIGASAFLGHVFSIYLRFKGGKGVASALGVFAVLCPSAALASLVLYLQTLKLSRVSALGSLNGTTTMALFICLADEALAYKVLVLALAAVIWWRHRENLQQIAKERRAGAKSELSSEGQN